MKESTLIEMQKRIEKIGQVLNEMLRKIQHRTFASSNKCHIPVINFEKFRKGDKHDKQ